MIYDRPILAPENRKYIGHLIQKISSKEVVAAMCLTVQGKDILIIGYKFWSNNIIREYEIM